MIRKRSREARKIAKLARALAVLERGHAAQPRRVTRVSLS
jgi:hypothetical protein